MTDDMNKKIKKAFSDITPDIFDSIRSKCNEQKGSAVIMTTNKKTNFKKFVSIAAAIVLVVAGLGLFGVYEYTTAVKAVVALDVNPSVEIKLNAKEKVVDVVPLNNDAEKIIGTMDFKNSDLTVTVNALVGSMLRNGYLTDITNSILVTVDGKDPSKNAELQNKIDAAINEVLGGKNLDGAVLIQENEANDEILALAEKYGISEGKAQLALKLSKELKNHTADDLAELSINELNILAEKAENVKSNGTASKKAYIGEEKALEIALSKANVIKADAKIIKIELDSDDGIMVYEIEFNVPPYEYDIDIHAENGEVLRFEKEADDDYRPTPEAPEKPVENTASVGTTASAVTYLSTAKIKAIALEKADVKENEISNYYAEFDMDDGVASYEVSFKTEKYEYDVEINAVTGAVLDFDKELLDDDEDYKPVTNPTNPEPTTNAPVNETLIGKDKAKNIALKHAGVPANEIRGYSCEYDVDDGLKVYDIEFEHKGYEYSYEINAVTGKIIDSEKEAND